MAYRFRQLSDQNWMVVMSLLLVIAVSVSQFAGLDSMSVIVMNLDDNDTIIQLVNSNVQRETFSLLNGQKAINSAWKRSK